MEKIWNYISRHALWLIAGGLAVWFLNPSIAEFKTLLLLISAECLSIAFSGLAVFAYTKIDFTKDIVSSNLGFIFLGVHTCIGLVVMGVYIAQFAN